MTHDTLLPPDFQLRDFLEAPPNPTAAESHASTDPDLTDEVPPSTVQPLDALLTPVLTDPSLLFGSGLLAAAAKAYEDPAGWTQWLRWMDTHKIAGLDRRRWKKEVMATAMDVAQRLSRQPVPISHPVHAIWPSAPDPTVELPSDSRWIYEPSGISAITREGLAVLGAPAYAAEWVRDIEDGMVSVTLRHHVGGVWDSLIVPADHLVKPEKIADLAKYGVGIRDPKVYGQYLNASYQSIRQTPAIRGTKRAGVQTVDGGPVAVFASGLWFPHSASNPPDVRLTDQNSGITFVQSIDPVSGTQPSAQTVFDHLIALANPQKFLPLIGWFAGCLRADQIRRISDGTFPIANVVAIHETGKTTLIKRLLAAIIGRHVPGGGGELGTVKDSKFQLTRKMAASTTIPLVLDEFRLSELVGYQLDLLNDLLRRDFDGALDGRGRTDLTIRPYRLIAPTLVSGESRIVDSALLDRIVGINLSPTDTKEWQGSKPHLEWLLAHPDANRECAGFLLQARLDSTKSDDQVRNEIAVFEQYLRSFGESHGWPDRALWGLAVCVFALHDVMSTGLQLPVLTASDWQAILSEGTKARKNTTPVDRYVRFLEEVVLNGAYRGQPVPMVVAEDGASLRVGISASTSAYELWLHDHNLPNLGQGNLEDELVRSPILSPNTNLRDRRRFGVPWNAVMHSYQFSVAGLETQYGIAQSFWADTLKRNVPEA